MRLFASGAAALLALSIASPALAVTSLNAGVSGTVSTNLPNPVPGQQSFTLTGGFTYYDASADLPQIAGGDLAAYSFTITGLSQSYNADTRTVVYENVTGTINGYGQIVQYLAPTTLTVAFTPDFSSATVLGELQSTGPVTPAGFPGPIDFSPANGAMISGTFRPFVQPGGNGSFDGAIILAAAAVPEPATWGMMILGVGAAGGALRRRRSPSVTYA